MSLNNDVEFSMIENGLDFIATMLNYTDNKEKNKYDVKYSVLHLSSGIELILKYKLMLLDWRDIFQDIKKADKDDLCSGDFISVYSKDCQKG